MATAFRIIQLSDSHVSADPDADYRGVTARRALVRVLDTVQRWGPDLILFTGDLSEDFSEASYAFIRRSLDDCGVPVVTTPGNHDLANLQKKHFADTATDRPLLVEAGGWRLVVLNSSVEGEIPGRLCEPMVAGLQRALGGDRQPKLVVLHHQPLPVGSAWIDRHPLREAETFWSVLEGGKEVRGVLWGHIHHAYREDRHGLLLLGAPSTVANSHPFEDEFRSDPAGPGCRWLKLEPDGALATGILRCGRGLSLQEAPATG
jgi:Icc protein